MSLLYLRKILNTNEVPEILTYLDTCEQGCRSLIWTMIKSHLSEGKEVHYLCYSIDISAIPQAIYADRVNFFKTYDLYSDPLQWNCVESLSAKLPFHDVINFSSVNSERKVVVVIDNINTVLNFISEASLYRNLHILKNQKCVSQVILSCQEDACSKSFVKALENLYPTTIRVNPTNPLTCKILIKRNNKIIKCEEECSVNTETFEVQYCRGKTSKSQKIPVDGTDSSSLVKTTFNLTLTDHQKEAKNKLILPHTRIQSTGGQIHYVPDAADDWDDEDPDEDLEI